MNCSLKFCRCCYSSEDLKMLCGPVLDVYTTITKFQSLDNSVTEIMACSRCYEFLNEVNRFRIERRVGDNNLYVNPVNIELVFKNPFDRNLSQIKLEYDNQIDEHINNVLNTEESLKTTDSVEMVEKCNKCTFKSNRKQHMIAHRIIHDKINFIVLLQRYEESIKENTGNYAEVRLYKDSRLCNSGIEEKFALAEPFFCDFCSFTTHSKYKLKDHTRSEHAYMYQYACDHCKYKSNVREHIVRHLKKHTMPKYHKCSECSFQSSLSYDVKRHYNRQHVNEKPFSCDQCDYRSNIKYNLKMHKGKHLINRENFKCDQCPYGTYNRSSLNRHIANIHCKDKKVYFCDHCDYQSTSRGIFLVHIRRLHTNGKLFKCTKCSFSGKFRSDLNWHARIHSDERPFFCEQCDYRCKYKKYLKIHMETHNRTTINVATNETNARMKQNLASV